jgi:hypothetical protein
MTQATCLGILAGCFTDGKVHLFAIPQPPIGESTGVQYCQFSSGMLGMSDSRQ